MTYIKLILTACFWGGTFIAGKVLSQNVDPTAAAFLRFLNASIFLLFLTLKIEGKLPRIPRNKIYLVVLSGLTGVFAYNLFFLSGLKYIQANRASLIIALNPIFISLFSVVFFKDKLSILKIAGLVLSVTGAMVVISNGHLLELFSVAPGKGELLIFGCVGSWVTYSLLGKKTMNSLSPVASVCYSSIAGMILLFFPALQKGLFSNIATYNISEWGSILYLGLFGTVLSFLWYYEGIKKIGPMKAGIFINFVPISAILLSFILLKEPVTKALIIGAVLVITGVYLTNSAGVIFERGFGLRKKSYTMKE